MIAFFHRRGDADAEEGWTWRWPVIIGGALAAAGLLAALVYVLASRSEEPPPAEENARPVDVMFSPPKKHYQPPPPPEIQPEPEPVYNGLSKTRTAAPLQTEEPKEDPFAEYIKQAQDDKVGEWMPQGQDTGQRFAASMAVSYYDPDACTIPTGTAIKAELISAAITSNASDVKAIVTHDVLCTNGDRGIVAGATLKGKAQQGADFGSERMDLVFTTLQQADMEIDLEQAAAGDLMGQGGVPGEVNRHAGQTALRVAVATLADIAIAAAGGGIWSPLIGTPTRAIDQWAQQALDRDPVISIDPGVNRIPITIITQKSIAL